MKLSTSHIDAALGWTLVMLCAPVCDATAAHRRAHDLIERKHTRLHARHGDMAKSLIAKRGTCAFPGGEPGLVAVTPDAMNGGWAMSPDQECTPGSYCPIACEPGMVMAQWDPDSSFTYPASMNGGLYCNDDGEIEKPFPDKPYCVQGTGAINAVNEAGSAMSWCQTVLPGNEAMLIPTLVDSIATLAVPDPSYWCGTASHFYINPPGTGTEGCVWGDESSPIGNWSPYVAGANTVEDGNTFVKIGWNPIFEGSALKVTVPDFGLKIECPDGGCNGLPCEIDPTGGVGQVVSNNKFSGAGGSQSCVVTVPKGKTANIVAYSLGGMISIQSEDEEEEEAETTSAPSTTSAEPTTSEAPTTTEPPTSVKSSSTMASTMSKPSSTSSSKKAKPSVKPGIFQEMSNDTDTSEFTSTETDSSSETSDNAPAATSDDKNSADRKASSAFASLVVACVAAVYFL